LAKRTSFLGKLIAGLGKAHPSVPGSWGGGLTLSPGSSPGTLPGRSQTWEGGGNYVWEINHAAGTAGADPGWDWINISGTLSIHSTPSNKFNIKLTTLAPDNSEGEMHNFSKRRSYTWTIATASSGIFGFSADAFNLDVSAFRNSMDGGAFGIEIAGHDLNVTFSPRPSPQARWWGELMVNRWIQAGLGLGGLTVVFSLFLWRMRTLRRIHALERENALNQQRHQIARDLHDEIGTRLTQIARLCETDQRSESAAGPDSASRRKISTLAEGVVDSLTDLVWATNPRFDTLDDLIAYLREYAAQTLESHRIQGRLDFPAEVPPVSLSPEFRRHLLLFVKEALHNILKHAEASLVEMRVRVSGSAVELGIQDDGKGFASATLKSNGNGLANMRQRVAELGGTFALESEPGHGTHLRVSVPLPPAHARVP